MSSQARRNGWRGFENIARKAERGWYYVCDGMPTMMGCGATVTVMRRWSRVGVKSSGWLVCYGLEPKPGTEGRFDDPSQWEPDEDVVLTFCPSCRLVVEKQ